MAQIRTEATFPTAYRPSLTRLKTAPDSYEDNRKLRWFVCAGIQLQVRRESGPDPCFERCPYRALGLFQVLFIWTNVMVALCKKFSSPQTVTLPWNASRYTPRTEGSVLTSCLSHDYSLAIYIMLGQSLTTGWTI